MNIKTTLVFISLGILVIVNVPQLASAQTIFPTGTTIYGPDEAYRSYILISDHLAVGNHPKAKVREEGEGIFPYDIRLIDMNGIVVHSWKVVPYFNKRCRLQPNGNLVCVGPEKTIFELRERIPRSSTSGLASTNKTINQSKIPRSSAPRSFNMIGMATLFGLIRESVR